MYAGQGNQLPKAPSIHLELNTLLVSGTHCLCGQGGAYSQLPALTVCNAANLLPGGPLLRKCLTTICRLPACAALPVFCLCPREVHALAREAAFYKLPGLVEALSKGSVMPQPATRAYFDSLYLETGYKSIEGPALKEMERCKVVVMQQMNHVLGHRAQEGFFVDHIEAGVQHRKDPVKGLTEHNLFYNILLKKVVPMVPRALQTAAAAAAAAPTAGRSGEGEPGTASQQQRVSR